MTMPQAQARKPRRDWREAGACREEDPELFFPITSKGPSARQILAAKAVCARCEVRSECLRFALDNRQDAGVWGGKSEDERRLLRLARRRERGRLDGVAAAS